MSLDEQFSAAGVRVSHHFGANEYAKQTIIPAGVVLTQHKHAFDHISILASGRALVSVDGDEKEYTGPDCILIEAGKSHSVTALTDVCWFCVHGTDCKDLEKIDGELIA
jgi:quercetin dioxygenase-like cupin family protein